jgi:hypothetical protein
MEVKKKTKQIQNAVNSPGLGRFGFGLGAG